MAWSAFSPKVEITTKEYCREQALHNISVAEKIICHKDCSDWAITCCYYSSIYFVEMLLFERTEIMLGGTKLRPTEGLPLRINLIHNFVRSGKGVGRAIPKEKHALRERIVAENFPEIRNEYSTLYAIGNKARYNYYKGYCFDEAKMLYEKYALKIRDWAIPPINSQK